MGKALPVLGIVAFYDRTWNDKWTSTIGYSMVDIDNSDGQAADAFKTGPLRPRQPALLPDLELLPGPRGPVGQARELRGRLHVDDFRIQFSAKYNFKLLRWEASDDSTHARRRRRLALALVASRPPLLRRRLRPPSRSRGKPRRGGAERRLALPGYTEADINAALQAAYAKYKDLKEGKNADYIPALAKVDPNIFGIALVTADGKVYTTGDVKSEVSIQSISKVFTMAQVIEESGRDAIPNNMGVDATGQVVQLDRRGRAVQGRRDERHGEPRRHHRHQHGQGREPRRDLEEEGPIPRVDGDGTSKSAASRRFVALSQQRFEEWLASDISKLDLLVIQMVGLHLAEDMVLIGAIGIDGKGDKHILGLIEGATENAAAVQALLDNLIERGLDPKVARLFILSRLRSACARQVHTRSRLVRGFDRTTTRYLP